MFVTINDITVGFVSIDEIALGFNTALNERAAIFSMLCLPITNFVDI